MIKEDVNVTKILETLKKKDLELEESEAEEASYDYGF